MLHFYTGNAKGKSTAAAGLALRALGRGWSVWMLHFLKGRLAGEDLMLQQLGAQVKLRTHELPPWERDFQDLQTDVLSLLEESRSILKHHHRGLVIFDELFGAMEKKLVKENDVQVVFDFVKAGFEVVVTGRVVPDWMVDRADYHSYMELKAHPFLHGIGAREGVEF